ncbi:MAG TPA: Asp-tRNA(Asn)/Glu-tRNA(Gln) amidotransferase subunit GatA [Candidatus Levybacteria bacterium]|nr:Asp-tRNA(Asn)/Glu-tRNA(Gln) amidotransferase subunit GatA [Candidatus Levybacteria bacterium]
MDTKNLTITEARRKLDAKELSSTELTSAYLSQIEKYDAELNAFITVTRDEALKTAESADKKIADGLTLPLLGIPIALKDIFVTKDTKTTAASNVLKDYIPQFDGTVVSKLKDAGAIILGKTNLDAWAHGSSGENSDFGPTRNPYNTDYVPGGSSSGSPAAVAANMALMATGTDTGGSIRLPASFTNTVGLKPTYGRVSRYGVIAMASSLDSIGHFTKTVEDNAHVLQITAGKDEYDGTTPNKEVPDYLSNIKAGVKGLKIGVPKEYFDKGLDPKINEIIQNALKFYESQGAEIIDVSLPHTQYAIEVYYIIQTAEVSSNLARYTGIRYGSTRQNFGDEAKRRIMLGTYVLSAGYYDAYYKKALQVRTLLKQDFEEAFKTVDVLLTPASPSLPFKIGAKSDDPLEMYLSDILTVHANLVGVPGLVFPGGFVDGLPVGIQLLGKHFDEATLYKTAYTFEQANPFWKETPNL